MYSNQILVVANEGPLVFLPELLERYASSYQVISFRNQKDAEDFCRCMLPVTVVCDIRLFSNPLQFLRLVSTAARYSLFPDIFLSGPVDSDLDSAFKEPHVFPLPADADAGAVLQLVLLGLSQQELKQRQYQQEQELRYLSFVDPVTAQKNALYLSEFLELESRQCLRYGHSLSVIIGRLDRDDEILNSLGLEPAQQMLVAFAQFIARRKRKCDVLARMSGSEMVLVLPHTDADGAMELADNMRKQLAQNTFTISGARISATSSFGLCQYRMDMEINWQLLLDYAGAALRQCRDGSGNACLLAE